MIRYYHPTSMLQCPTSKFLTGFVSSTLLLVTQLSGYIILLRAYNPVVAAAW